MNERTVQKALMKLLCSAILNEPITEEIGALISEDMLPPLFSLAQKHDVAHLIGYAFQFNKIDFSENSYFQAFRKMHILAIVRYEQLNFELKEICKALENAKIPFMPLKGSVLRNDYPEPWMRTSCDIDILVRQADLEAAVQYLNRNCAYRKIGAGSHDVILSTKRKIHVELHYDLIEKGRANSSSTVLKDVWKESVLKPGYSFWHEMRDEWFYLYNIAHMAKHFEFGGCGIRSIIDTWILNDRVAHDQEQRTKLLQKADLLKFDSAVRHLIAYWFKDEVSDPVTQAFGEFIISGGIIGNKDNYVAVQQQKQGGKTKYAVSRIILSYDDIKFLYPILQKHKWLTPVMQIRRWGDIVFSGRMNRSIDELKINRQMTSEKAKETAHLLEQLGLK